MKSKFVEKFTVRASERRILILTAQGKTMKEIAEELGLTKAIVMDRQRKMKERNGCRNIVHLVARALRNKYIS